MESTMPLDTLSLVDTEKGTVDRRIFSDQDIYELELERIFARAWNFMAHDSQIPNPGDFFMTFIGEDRVIVVRDNDGNPQILVNSCRHRGNAICRADEGHSTSFMCTYHGWTYDLKGNLVGVPGFKEVYHEELDRESWGLIKAAYVDTYKGYIFATFDSDAPPLDEYLGDVGRMGIDMMVARGDNRVIGGVQKWTIGCNWKFAVDNVWDFYHGFITHASATIPGWVPGLGISDPRPLASRFSPPQLTILGDYGHVIGGPAWTDDTPSSRDNLYGFEWHDTAETQQTLGPVGLQSYGHPHIFPNLWFMPSCDQVSLRLPKGPSKTEIWWFIFVNDDFDAATQLETVRVSIRGDGPAGLFELDDGENWGESTRGSKGTITKRYPLNYAMQVGRGEVTENENGPPSIASGINEHPQLWYYKSWSEWLAAESYEDLKDNHFRSPSGFF